jgi:hypothetical protein
MPTGPFDPSTRTDLKTVRAGYRKIAVNLEHYSAQSMRMGQRLWVTGRTKGAFLPGHWRSNRKLLVMY